MNRLFLVILTCCSLAFTAIAQKKPVKKEKPPTTEEMAEMMNAMQEGMSGMSEEDKRLMDSLGFKMPNLQDMQKMAAFAMANEQKAGSQTAIPKKDANRIAAIPKMVLTSATIGSYLQKLQQQLTAKLPAELQAKTRQQLNELRKENSGKNISATAAMGYLAFGNVNAALLVMTEACKEDPSDANNLNNLAALLNMNGGEHLSLPILQLLNKQYPRNSTILNNLAHAWFGLGDLVNAGKYIDSTIRLCAWHPQANQIKAAIEESKGNTAAAVKAAKQAISRMYSQEKQDKLNDLDYKLKADDINWKPANATDQLGLSKFSWPGIPKTVGESVDLEPVWNRFRQDWDASLNLLIQQQQALAEAARLGFEQRLKQNLGAAVLPKAVIKLRPYVEDLLEREAKDPLGLALLAFQDTLNQVKAAHEDELRKIYEKIKPGREGEGINEGYCAAIDAANDKLLRDVNSRVEAFCLRQRDRAKKRLSELVNYKFYSEFPEQFELSVNQAKIEWLSYIMLPKDMVIFRSPEQLCFKKGKKDFIKHALADYDDINCTNRSLADFIFGSIETNCGRTIARIDAKGIKLDWETRSADREENRNFWDEFQRCTIEVTAGESKKIGKGPLQLEASLEATGFLEFDRSGLKDAGIKAEIGVDVKTNVLDTKVQTEIGEVKVGPSERSVSLGGAEASFTINSGFTAGGKGIFQGVRL